MSQSPNIELQIAEEAAFAVEETFRVMMNLHPAPHHARIERAAVIYDDILGLIPVVRTKETGDEMISMIEDETVGHFILSFPKETIFFLLKKLLQKDFTDVGPEVKDAVGEFTNVIYGVIKNSLLKLNIELKSSVPVVTLASHQANDEAREAKIYKIPFVLGDHTFTAWFCPSTRPR